MRRVMILAPLLVLLALSLDVQAASIFVDPELRLVMVVTAATRNADVVVESYARERGALWRGIVTKYGSW